MLTWHVLPHLPLTGIWSQLQHLENLFKLTCGNWQHSITSWQAESLSLCRLWKRKSLAETLKSQRVAERYVINSIQMLGLFFFFFLFPSFFPPPPPSRLKSEQVVFTLSSEVGRTSFPLFLGGSAPKG